MNKLLNISELSKLLNLTNVKTKKPSNHILRYWEREFKQIRPTIIRNRRYYSKKQIEIVVEDTFAPHCDRWNSKRTVQCKESGRQQRPWCSNGGITKNLSGYMFKYIIYDIYVL